MNWIPLTPDAPKDRVLLGCWRDARGDDVPVLIAFDDSNPRSNHGFIGVNGDCFGAGGITHFAEIEMPDGTVPQP